VSRRELSFDEASGASCYPIFNPRLRLIGTPKRARAALSVSHPSTRRKRSIGR
jgi:hypothetical protein